MFMSFYLYSKIEYIIARYRIAIDGAFLEA